MSSDATCRICFDVGDEPLISPCAGCRGTSAFVHFQCVKAFYESRHDWTSLHCPTCKRQYEGAAAVELGRSGLQHIEQKYGPDHRKVAAILNDLSIAYGDLGDTARQHDLLERALAIQEQEYGPDHRAFAMTLRNLGAACGCLGDAARQRDLQEQALTIQERGHGPNHREVAVTLNSLGNAYGDLGDADRQRDLQERTLAILEREYGPDLGMAV